MSDAGKLARGEKWKRVRAYHVARGTPDNMVQVKWMDSQPNIIDNIKFYEDSIAPKPEPKLKGKGRVR